MERSGQSVKQILVKSSPFPKITCPADTCVVCSTNPKVNCKKREVAYVDGEHNEQSKRGVYEGETSRSICERFDEHMRDYKSKLSSSVFYKHIQEVHNCEIQKLNLDIRYTCPADPMLRQITESVLIKENAPDLNRKSEWGNSNVPRKRRTVNESSQ